MKIAIDAMGGDYAPAEIVKGAALGSKLHDVDVVLIGDKNAIRKHLPSEFANDKRITIHHTSEVIGMDEHAAAVRTKKDASVVVAADMVRDGLADAMVSVGNTAAAMAVATLKLGRIESINRPAIATVVPGKFGPSVLLDAGAVADCSPQNLLEFGVMGSIYAEKVFGINNPKVALLSIGEEKSKGNEVTKLAHSLLESSGLNFIGNVEGRHLFFNTADVIVADGFAGNVALKVAEGVGEFLTSIVKDDLKSHPLGWIGVILLVGLLKRVKKKTDYSEYGGAPLLGLNNICIIGHGRSNARAVANAVKAAKEAVNGGVVSAIQQAIAKADQEKITA